MTPAFYSLARMVKLMCNKIEHSRHAAFSILFNKPVRKTFWQRLHAAAFLIIITAGIFSCRSAADKTKNSGTEKDSSGIIVLPRPVPLAKTEWERLHFACQRWYDSVLLSKGFNGAMLVAKNGNIVFETYAGTAHIPGTDTIRATTPLHIASVSKTFTAMGILKLWQDGKLNIDDEVSKYIPAFNYPGITVRSLLNHRSGLPNYTHFLENMGWDKTKTITNEELLNFLITNKSTIENIAPPNTRFTYCNTNYALLALVIEKVAGQKLREFLQQTFFTPLQMKNTFVCTPADSLKMNPSYNWRGIPEGLNFLDAVYGDKNIYTTPQDLLIWDRALSSNKIFRPEILTQAYTPYSNEKPGVRNYGLGWRMNIYPDGKKMIYHNGWWHGSNAAFIRLLKEDATIIVIGNKFNRGVYSAKTLSGLFSDYYGGEEDDENDNSKVPDSINRVKSAAPALPTSKLSKKQTRQQQFFKDKNKVTTH